MGLYLTTSIIDSTKDLDDVNFESLIENVIEESFDRDSWYNAYEYSITELENGKLFVSLACESSD